MAMTKKKKKKYIGLLVLVVLCAALFGGYAALVQYNASQEEEEETEEEELEDLFADLDSGTILEVTYTVEGDTMTFTRESSDDDWLYSEDEDYPIDQSAVSSVVTTSCAISITQVIASDLSNMADFGLDDPYATVTMTDEDGEEYTFYIGNTTGSSTSYYYAYKEGDDRVLSIPSTIISKLETDIQELLDVDSYPSLDSDTFTRIYYEDETQTMELFNDPEDLTTAEAIGTTTWYYLDDGVYMPLNQSNSTTLLDTITGIEFVSCVNYNASDEELEEYGLADPYGVLTVEYTVTESNLVETETTDDDGSSYVTETTTTDNTLILNIGNATEADEDGVYYYYVTLGDDTAVYTVASDSIEVFVGNVLSDYVISLYPTLCNFDGIEEIDVSYDDKSMHIEVEQSTEEDEDGEETTVYTCTLNGDSYEEDDTRSIFADLIGVTADHIIADEDIVDNEVIFSCTFTTNFEKKPTITFEICKLDSTYYQLSLNGNAKYAITKQEFNSLISSIEEFLE